MSGGEVPAGCSLVASGATEDARLVASLLREDFPQVRTSTNDKKFVADFDSYCPRVLVLAFRTLADAERYYLGLYRLSEHIHATSHRTVILCDHADAFRVFDQCRKQHFDEYVLFWPVSHDPYRLRMAAMRALHEGDEAPTAQQFASHARRMARLKGQFEQQLADGARQIESIAASIELAERHVDSSMHDLSRRFEDGTYSALVEMKDGKGLRDELQRFRADELQAPLDSMVRALGPVRQWMAQIGTRVEPSLRSAQALATMAARVKPLILVVDDDPLQHRLLQHQLASPQLDVAFASNATGALSLLRARRPDLILLDFNLPDSSGAELLHRLKAADRTRHIPVIMISGTTTKDVVVESHRAGAVEVIAKPLDPSRLFASIERHLMAAASEEDSGG